MVLVLIACVGGAAVATKLATPTYEATSKLLVSGSSGLADNNEIVTDQLAAERASSFAEIIPTAPAVQAALKEAEAKSGPFSSSGYPAVNASASGTNPFIDVTVTDTDPRRAQAVANAMATELPKVLRQLQQPSATPHEIELIQAASLPSNPSSPKPKENLIIGLALGLVLGVGAALLVEALDRRLKDSAEVEAASGLTALGVIPFEIPGEPIPAATHPRSVRAEAYRQVRTNLAFVTDGGPPKSVIITSSASSEGKTSLAVNLADQQRTRRAARGPGGCRPATPYGRYVSRPACTQGAGQRPGRSHRAPRRAPDERCGPHRCSGCRSRANQPKRALGLGHDAEDDPATREHVRPRHSGHATCPAGGGRIY